MFKKDNKIYYEWTDYSADIKQVKNLEFDHVVGIYRGSLPVAVHISNVFKVPMSIVGFQTRDGKDKEPYMIKVEKTLAHAWGPTKLLVVDDIYDSGYTMKRVIKMLSYYSEHRIQSFCLFGKENNLNVSYANEHDGSWIVFPWEYIEGDNESV